jgi:hypothetical protein
MVIMQYHPAMHVDPNVERAMAFLRSHSRGDLRFDEHVQPIKYVIAPQDGRLVAPVMVAMLRSADVTLCVPADQDGALELMVTLEEFNDKSGEQAGLADRWRIHHGEPDDVRWALMLIDAARFDGMFIDGEALMQSNPLAADEARLCREMNIQHIDALRDLCDRRGHMRVEQPVMVGVDPRGIDVRARFDIVRVPFPRGAVSIDDARKLLLPDSE